jgi:hypothetical protein
MVGEWGVLPFTFPQIAYGTDSIIQGLIALQKATGDDTYGKLAGLAAGWFYGNNAAGFPLYDPAAAVDGLLGSQLRVNMNLSAESTIEALMALAVTAIRSPAATHLPVLPVPGRSWRLKCSPNRRCSAVASGGCGYRRSR